jgi:radical SAM superfamily enzyme YgiQ (UPF0313 family)
MRVCLVSSVNLSSWFNQDCEPTMLSLPLGVLSLAAVLEKEGHTVTVVDFNYALSKGEIALDNDFYVSAASKIVESSPDIVGFSTMCNSYHIALRIAEAVKAKLPHLWIVFGGPQASVVDIETIEAFPFVDMVLRGEAEETLPKLVSTLSNGKVVTEINGLTYRAENGIIRCPDASLLADLDTLPTPAYHLFPYKIEGPVAMDIGRGCPFDCSFCSTSTFWRRQFRLKSIDRILQEMCILKSKYEVTSFSFMHDLFTANKQWLRMFCERLEAQKMGITWTCSARIDCVDSSLLKLMASVGCQAVFYGVETGSPRMQKEVRKNLKLDQVPQIVNATLEAKMGATLSFIAGFPAETEEDLVETMNFIQGLLAKEVNIQLHLLAPQVGTLEYKLHSDTLRFDGYYSDIAGVTSKFLEIEWFKRFPKLFASYYYFENKQVPRDFLRGLDLFVQGPVAIMRGTVLHLLKPGYNLFSLYRDWHTWAISKGLDKGWTKEKIIDQLLLDFYEFANVKVADGCTDFDMGHSRDEILAFYLRQFGQVPVHFVSIEKENKEQSNCQERN